MLTDAEISRNTKLKNITDIGRKIDVLENELELYGNYKAKVVPSIYKRLKDKPNGKLILVTAVNPTPAGEGKTTVSIGLSQAFNMLGKKSVLSLREPSLGPVFGLKGGATGGGYSQVVPMDEINLHFTGDIHAITAANNLLCAVIDNHIYQGNSLNIDPNKILIKRCLDINDRALRNIKIGLGKEVDGVPRNDGFIISVASEIMAIFCLASDFNDLRLRLDNMLVAFNRDMNPIFAKELKVTGAMLSLLKDAFKPNLVQTTERTAAIIHGGPFANIAHGCSSVQATKLALKLSNYCVTEAGFGSDLGGEKFFDIKCRFAGLKPSAVVLVATVRALKYNGGISDLKSLEYENLDALSKGICNLERHIKNLKQFNVPIIVCINKFCKDSDNELEYIKSFCTKLKVKCVTACAYTDGGEGCIELAKEVINLVNGSVKNDFLPIYSLDDSIEEKIKAVATKVYGAKDVVYTEEALKSLEEINRIFPTAKKMPVCIAKTQYSLSDNKNLLGAPENFAVTVKDIKPRFGAGFITVYMGDIVTMPGLPKVPAAESIGVDLNGNIVGIF